MEKHLLWIPTARFALLFVFPKLNPHLFIIYLFIKYVTETKKGLKRKQMDYFGLKWKIIPEDVHSGLIQDVNTKVTYGLKHQIIVPQDYFKGMYEENIYYRCGNSLWMSLELKTKVDKSSTSSKTDVNNVKNFLMYEKSHRKESKHTQLMSLLTQSSSRSNDSTCFNERIVQIVPSTKTDSTVYLTDIESFNILNNSRIKNCVQDFQMKFSPIESVSDAPKIAKQVTVQMIHMTPKYIGSDLIDLIINNYFKTPKFLHSGDYFEIPLVEEYTGHLHLKYLSVVKTIKRMYFKCTNIKAHYEGACEMATSVGYFVIRGETEMIQEQNINSYIPKRQIISTKYVNGESTERPLDNSFISTCPHGLDKYLNELKMSVLPFLLDKQVSILHTELKCVLQPVFLLRGSPGSGRELLVKLLSQHLGVHLLAASCRHLTSTTAKQTEAKLDAVFQQAKTIAPAIIHLKDFDLFGLDAEKNEDKRIVESFVKKLTNLYENFTKFPIIIIASCEVSTELKSNLARIFLEEFEIKTLNKAERYLILEWMVIATNIILCDDLFNPFNEPSVICKNKNDKDGNNENIFTSHNSEVENNNTALWTKDTKQISVDKKGKRTKYTCGKKSQPESNSEQKFEKSALEMVSVEERLMQTKFFEETSKAESAVEEYTENISTPNEIQNKELNDNSKLEDVKMKLSAECSSVIHYVSSKTDTYLYGDLITLTKLAVEYGYKAQSESQDGQTTDHETSQNKCVKGLVRKSDFENAIETLRLLQSKKLGSLKIPNVQWEDIGGMEDLKKEISRTIELPLKFPHLLANSGLKRSGLLLWGPPGCGKTLVARAIASQLQASFLSIKGPELLDMYVGQSERNMRDMFASARASAPCVIFLDEAEAAAGARGAAGDAGGAADRLVSQLLAELDGVAARQDAQAGAVLVVAATNRPDLVEPALLRPGRLDKLLYVGPYQGQQNKHRVLLAACRSFNLHQDVDLTTVSDLLPDKCTGADLAAIANQARRRALSRVVQMAESGDLQVSELSEQDVVIHADDFLDAIQEFVPSISDAEMNYYESLRHKLS